MPLILCIYKYKNFVNFVYDTMMVITATLCLEIRNEA